VYDERHRYVLALGDLDTDAVEEPELRFEIRISVYEELGIDGRRMDLVVLWVVPIFPAPGEVGLRHNMLGAVTVNYVVACRRTIFIRTEAAS
jgi:hypothetical protein